MRNVPAKPQSSFPGHFYAAVGLGVCVSGTEGFCAAEITVFNACSPLQFSRLSCLGVLCAETSWKINMLINQSGSIEHHILY